MGSNLNHLPNPFKESGQTAADAFSQQPWTVTFQVYGVTCNDENSLSAFGQRLNTGLTKNSLTYGQQTLSPTQRILRIV